MAHALIGEQLDAGKRPEYSYGKPTARRASLPAVQPQPPSASCRRASLPAPSPLQIFSPARRASLQREHAAALQAEYAAAMEAVAMEEAHTAQHHRAAAPDRPHNMLRSEYGSVRRASGARFYAAAAPEQQPAGLQPGWSCFQGTPCAGGQPAAHQHWRPQHRAAQEYSMHADRVTSFDSDGTVYAVDGVPPPASVGCHCSHLLPSCPAQTLSPARVSCNIDV